MKRTTKEIFIEIKIIRVTKKRSVQKKPVEQTKPDVSPPASSFEKTDERPDYPFDKLFLRRI